MKIKQIAVVSLLTVALVFFAGYPAVYGGSCPPSPGTGGVAPWFPDNTATGKNEYSGRLYIDFVDTGKNNIPGNIGTEDAFPSFEDKVVYINFLLVLDPIRPNQEPMFFSDIAKTCEQIDEFWPVCPAGTASYNIMFNLPSDYCFRMGAALHGFLKETVYPALCGDADCGDLKQANPIIGVGNAQEVGRVGLSDPNPPWYWIQPLTIVTRR
jgi:hypothetical protein